MTKNPDNVVRIRPRLRPRPLEPEPPEPYYGDLLRATTTIKVLRRFGDELVYGLIPKNRFIGLYGQPACGKSTLASSIAYAVATGTRFLDLETEQAGVIYVAAERYDDVARMLKSLAAKHGEATDCLWLTRATSVDLSTKGQEFVEEIRALCKHAEREGGRQCELLFVDTLAAVLPGSDEGAQDYSEVANLLRKLLPDLTVVVLAHEGKNPGRGVRGSSVITAAVDLTIKVFPVEDRSLGRGAFKVEKSNVDMLEGKIHYRTERIECGANNLGRIVTVSIVDERVAGPPEERKRGKHDAELVKLLRPLFDKGRQLPRYARAKADADSNRCVLQADLLRAITAAHHGSDPATKSERKVLQVALRNMIGKGEWFGWAKDPRSDDVMVWPKNGWLDIGEGDDGEPVESGND